MKSESVIKGVYKLFIKVSRNLKLKVGSLDIVRFEKGVYVYVGSAQNNIRSRVKRHFSRKKKIFWHLDYLLNSRYSKIIKVFYKKGKKSIECKIAKRLMKIGTPILGFGCSDCRCMSHLFKIEKIGIPLKGFKEFPLGELY